MMLRRAVEHLKHQHWTAFAIELVIVILGVFIGMQVSNWNQARVEHERGSPIAPHSCLRAPGVDTKCRSAANYDFINLPPFPFSGLFFVMR